MIVVPPYEQFQDTDLRYVLNKIEESPVSGFGEKVESNRKSFKKYKNSLCYLVKKISLSLKGKFSDLKAIGQTIADRILKIVQE